MKRLRLRWKAMLALVAVVIIVGVAPFAVGAAGSEPAASPITSDDQICTREHPRVRGLLSNILSDLVTQGIISQDQSERIASRLKTRAHDLCVAAHLLRPSDVLDATADLLNMDTRDVLRELAGGKSLAELAVEHGSSVDELKASLTALAQGNAADLVREGKLSQEDADAGLALIAQRLDALVNWDGLPAGLPGRHRLF